MMMMMMLKKTILDEGAFSYLELVVFRDQTLNVLFDHFALNVGQSIDAVHMMTHGVDILPAGHRIGADARMRRA